MLQTQSPNWLGLPWVPLIANSSPTSVPDLTVSRPLACTNSKVTNIHRIASKTHSGAFPPLLWPTCLPCSLFFFARCNALSHYACSAHNSSRDHIHSGACHPRKLGTVIPSHIQFRINYFLPSWGRFWVGAQGQVIFIKGAIWISARHQHRRLLNCPCCLTGWMSLSPSCPVVYSELVVKYPFICESISQNHCLLAVCPFPSVPPAFNSAALAVSSPA